MFSQILPPCTDGDTARQKSRSKKKLEQQEQGGLEEENPNL